MTTLLITAIGGDIAQGVATIIRESRPDIHLVGVDMRDRHGGELFVDIYRRIPSAGAADYVSALNGIMDEFQVDVLLPISEPELEVLMHNSQEVNKPWISCGQEVLQAGLDKLETAHILQTHKIPGPWTASVADGSPRELPCILKSRTGSGSRDVFILRDQVDVDYYSKKFPCSIYQELLEPADRELTCAVYRTTDGRISVLQLHRELSGGLTGWAHVVDDTNTFEMCCDLAEGLKLKGSMNIQLRLTNEGPRIFEINPRFSSTALMRHRFGFTDVIWSIEEWEGKHVEFPIIKPGKTAVRTQNAQIVESVK